jgi:hypothetical protein
MDLVDASNKKAGYVANMREEDLPAEMKKMSVKEREKICGEQTAMSVRRFRRRYSVCRKNGRSMLRKK